MTKNTGDRELEENRRPEEKTEGNGIPKGDRRYEGAGRRQEC